MKKIPTLFERKFENHRVVGITDNITPGCEDAFYHGIATIKLDGSCCAIIDGLFYKRYDCKKGKTPPEGAIPCCDPDPITGHWPHWVKVNPENPADKWFDAAYIHSKIAEGHLYDGTYEAVGPHFQGNPYGFTLDMLVLHGAYEVYVERTFEAIGNYLNNNSHEGLVFWYKGEPVCKIKRSDFGFEWPVKKGE